MVDQRGPTRGAAHNVTGIQRVYLLGKLVQLLSSNRAIKVVPFVSFATFHHDNLTANQLHLTYVHVLGVISCSQFPQLSRVGAPGKARKDVALERGRIPAPMIYGIAVSVMP